MPRLLIDIAADCRKIYDDCALASPDLFGGSVLDLCADNLSDIPLDTLKDAIVISGIAGVCNARIAGQIARYAHTGN